MQVSQIQEEISIQDCKCLSSCWVLGPTARASFSSQDASQYSVWLQIESTVQPKNIGHLLPLQVLHESPPNDQLGFHYMWHSSISNVREPGSWPWLHSGMAWGGRGRAEKPWSLAPRAGHWPHGRQQHLFLLTWTFSRNSVPSPLVQML